MIKDSQRKIIEDFVKLEAERRGITINPLLVGATVEAYYQRIGKRPGDPVIFPHIQKARELFDIDNYNLFIEMAVLDLKTLQSYVNKARMSSRDLLVINDVKTTSFKKRLENIKANIKNFKVKETEESGVFEKTFEHSLIASDYFYENNPLWYDQNTSSLSLGLINSRSRKLSKEFLERATVDIKTNFSFSDIVSFRDSFPFANAFDLSSRPWTRELVVRGKHSSGKVIVTIQLPYIEEINSITWSPVVGRKCNMEILVSREGDNFIPIDQIDTSLPRKVNFSPMKVLKIQLIQTVSPSEVLSDKTRFVFSLKSLGLFRNVMLNEGSIIIPNIDPGINNRPILEAILDSDSIVPEMSQIKYFISKNGEDIPSTEVTSNGEVKFSLTKNVKSDFCYVSRTKTMDRNAINFYSLWMTDENGLNIDDFSTETKSYLPEYAELWTQQNCFKKMEMEEFSEFDIQDAYIMFRDAGEAVDIIADVTLVDCILRQDSAGQFIELPLKLTSDLSYHIDRYDSLTPEVLEDITTRGSVNNSQLKKIYVTGTYKVTDNFKVSARVLVDESVVIDRFTTELHHLAGKDGTLEANQVPYNLNYYTIDPESNKITALKLSGNQPNPVENKTLYLNFTGTFYTPRFDLYETYITFNDFYDTINLRNKMTVDSESGEYITLRNVETGELSRLENVEKLTRIKKGTYLLSVMSKPQRVFSSGQNPPSAIQAVLSCRVDPGNGVTSEADFPLLFNIESNQSFISQISVIKEPLKYRGFTQFLNNTKRLNSLNFSSFIDNGVLKFLVSDSGYELLKISGSEGARLNVKYFDEKVDSGSVQNKLTLKIQMKNNSSTHTSLITPQVNKLKFTVKYV